MTVEIGVCNRKTISQRGAFIIMKKENWKLYKICKMYMKNMVISYKNV